MTPEQSAATAQSIDRASSIIATSSANAKTRKWNEKILGQQRQWATEDWNRVNAYNHPTQQMARLREAGLNPNLVYGNGATTQAEAVRGTQAQNYSPQSIMTDVNKMPSVMSTYQDARLRNLEADLLTKNITVKAQEAERIRIESMVRAQDLQNKTLQYDIQKSLFPGQLDMQSENIRKTGIQSDMMLEENNRRNMYAAIATEKWAEEFKNMGVQRRLGEAQISQLNQNVQNLKAILNKVQAETKGVMWDNQIKPVLMESALIGNILKWETIEGQELKNETERIRQKFRSMGLSETVTSDLLKEIFGIGRLLQSGKQAQQLKSQPSPSRSR
jgi:hypothetical protein